MSTSEREEGLGKLLKAIGRPGGCSSLPALVRIVRELPSGETMSLSKQFLGETRDGGYGIFLKISPLIEKDPSRYQFDMYGPHTGLEAEARIYGYIGRVLMRFSPHFVRPVGAVICGSNTLEQLLGASKGERVARELARSMIEKTPTVLQEGQFLITILQAVDPTTSMKLEEFLENATSWQSQVKPVLFQLFYTLSAMTLVELAHNDLHPNNLFVFILPKPMKLRYELSSESEVFEITTKYFLAIFDWDRGAKSGLGADSYVIHNPGVTFEHARHGTWGTFSYYADYYQILYHLVKSVRLKPSVNKQFNDFLQGVVLPRTQEEVDAVFDLGTLYGHPCFAAALMNPAAERKLEQRMRRIFRVFYKRELSEEELKSEKKRLLRDVWSAQNDTMEAYQQDTEAEHPEPPMECPFADSLVQSGYLADLLDVLRTEFDEYRVSGSDVRVDYSLKPLFDALDARTSNTQTSD